MAKKPRPERAKQGMNRKLVYAALLVAFFGLTVLSGYYFYLMPRPASEWKATIIDQLSIDANLVNPAFVGESTSLLNSSGFAVDYYGGEDVNISFYRDLPTTSGRIAILRTHSSVRDNTDYVDLFTSEVFQADRYLDLASERQISKAQMYSSGEWYFAIGPTFVDLSAKGRFADSLIILMGCSGLNQTTMAEALVAKGAKAVVGWTDWIELDDTDQVTLALLQHLLVKHYTIGGAVETIDRTILDILGHSPSYGATLTYYPSSAKNQLIETKETGSSTRLLQGTELSLPTISAVPKRKALYRSEDAV